MPGPLDAAWAGVKHSFSDLGQSAEVIQGQKPTPQAADDNPAAAPFEMRDLYEPFGRGLPKMTYRLGESSPTVAAGIAGGFAGAPAGPIGALAGGAGGAALGAALQTIGPAFAQELKKNSNDPDGAWDRAVKSTLISGAASGASWAAFPLKVFNGPLKGIAFKAFNLGTQAAVVQPGISVAAQAGKNVVTGDNPTEGLLEAYKEGAIGTAVPAVGHLALKDKILGMGQERVGRSEAPTQAESLTAANELMAKGTQKLNDSMTAPTPDIARKLMTQAGDYHEAAAYELDRHQAPARIAAKEAHADQLMQQSQNPNLSPVDALDLRNQASTWRREAQHDGFIANLAPPLPAKPGRIKQLWLDNIQPEKTSEAATKADAILADYKSGLAQIEDSLIRHGTETYRYKWNKVAWDDQKRFINSYEENLGVPQDLAAKFPWMDKAYDDYRKQFQMDYEHEVSLGSRAHWLENYFPHQWDNADKARQVFQPDNMIRSMGSEWFQKARDYELVQYGEANGLKLKYDNVQEMVTQRRLAGADMIKKMEMLHELEKNGVAVPTEQAPAHVKNPALVGSPYHWQEISSPIGEKWMIAPDVQALWKNGVEAKGLWANEGAVGDAFRKWMKLKAAWVPIKLGLSAFHPVHVAHILGAGNIVRGLTETFGTGQQSLGRRLWATPEALLHTLGDAVFATTPFAPHSGKSIMKSWATPKELQTPKDAANIRLINEMGISAQLSEQLRMGAIDGFRTAWSKNQYLRALPKGLLATYEGILQKPIFEKWIPSLKMAAAQRESDLLLRRRPDLVTDDVNRRVAMRAIGKSIDNRFGEMFYGSLFWDRTLKDAAIGSFLSLGWNLGFAREFGGGFFEPIVKRMLDAPNPTRQLIRQTTSKTTNMFIYSMTAMAINAMMTKTMSGEDPEGLDLIFPRIGGLNPDGSPRRITNAFYTREVPMALKNMQERQNVVSGLAQMLYHKMLFAPFVEMGTNRDYFGNSIRDENSPAYKQIWQFGSHLLGQQVSPMSISGAKRALELSGKPHDTTDILKQMTDRDVYMPLLGFGPAPSYASKSPLQNRLDYVFKDTVAPERKSFEVAARSKERSDARRDYMGAMQRGDQDAKMAAAVKLRNLGVATKEIAKIQPGGADEYKFKRLAAEDKVALMKTMTPDEFKKFFPLYRGKKEASKLDPEMVARWLKYNQPTSGWGPAP